MIDHVLPEVAERADGFKPHVSISCSTATSASMNGSLSAERK
jgi:hypothetical protein